MLRCSIDGVRIAIVQHHKGLIDKYKKLHLRLTAADGWGFLPISGMDR